MVGVLERLGQLGIIPVASIKQQEDAVAVGSALGRAGLECIEVAFRTPAAEESIRRIAAACPGILVGAGTVLTVAQAERAVQSGACFIVSPAFDPTLVDWCLAHQIPIMPGVATPTEINMAMAKGLSILKYFPAEAMGGTNALRAIGPAFGGIRFVPTGGIHAGNLAEYISEPVVFACGGTWMVEMRLIAEKRFDEITRLAQAALAIVQQARA